LGFIEFEFGAERSHLIKEIARESKPEMDLSEGKFSTRGIGDLAAEILLLDQFARFVRSVKNRGPRSSPPALHR
jgi:hypothetical protein